MYDIQHTMYCLLACLLAVSCKNRLYAIHSKLHVRRYIRRVLGMIVAVCLLFHAIRYDTLTTIDTVTLIKAWYGHPIPGVCI